MDADDDDEIWGYEGEMMMMTMMILMMMRMITMTMMTMRIVRGLGSSET